LSPNHEVRPASHEESRLALPWLANGTLDAAERQGVEAHVAACAECAADLAAERRLHDELRGTTAVSPAPHPVQLARLWSRIDGSEESAPAPRRGRARSPLAGWPRAARWLVAAQAATILLLLALGTPFGRERSGAFRTLAAGDLANGAAGSTERLRVVFADTLDQRSLREILLPLGAEIVAGPSPLGVYTLVLPADAEPIGWVLTHLRARPEVRFAEPVRDEAEP
jgi:anti-sigma factor RsiW